MNDAHDEDRDSSAPEAPPPPTPRMRGRVLGRTGIELTELTLGTWGLADGAYGPVAEETFEATVKAALDAGIRAFDTACLWGDGASQSVVGRALGERREECIHITRLGWERHEGTLHPRFGPEQLREALHRSLERLQTDYVDVVLIHDPPEDVLEEGAFAKACAGLLEEKSASAWGVSCATADKARKAMRVGAEVLCLPYNLLTLDAVADLEDEIAEADCGLLLRSPLLHGLLRGDMRDGQRFPPDDHRSERWDAVAFRTRLGHARAMRFLVRDEVKSPRSAALRFALSERHGASVIIGPRDPLQVTQLVEDAGSPPYLAREQRARVSQVLAAIGV